jgi:16S rRNA processing protein RimM
MASSSRSAKSRARGRGAAAPRDPGTPAGLVTIGRIVAPHGLRGEVRVRLETDFPHRFEGLREAWLVHGETTAPMIITGQRPHRGGVLLVIEGVTDVDAAERLRGAAIAVGRDAVMPLGPDEFYVFEVIGLRVRTADGRILGTVAEVVRAPGNDVYLVRGDDGEMLIPALRTVVRRVDLASGEMLVNLPAGFEVGTDAR